MHGATAGRVSDLIQKIPAHRTPAAGQMRMAGSWSKEVGQTMIAGKQNRVKQLKVEELKAKRPFKLHTDKAGQAKTDLHMCVDMLKGTKDMFTIDVAEAEPHIKLVGKLDAEADVLKKATGEKANEPLPEPLSMKKAKKPLPKPLSMKKKQPEPKKMPKRKYRIAAKTMPAACNPPFFRQHVRQGAFCPQCEAGIQDRAGHRQEESSEAEWVD